MASMLRSLRHLRPIINRTRPLITHLRAETWSCLGVQSMTESRRLILLSRCLTTRTRTARRGPELEDDAIGGMPKLDRILHRLDSDARRIGRIVSNDVNNLLKEIKLAGGATSTQCLLLIRCCGSLIPDEHPENRTILLAKALQEIKALDIPLDVSHYNAILKVYLENEYKFSPTDFLSEMESKKIEPNRVTYQRLISHYCQQGDIAGASKILEFMKSKNLPINENVFNALIQGHSKVGDMQSAKSMIDVMKSAQLEPTSETYLNLISGYAERGNMDEIRNIIIEAENNDIILTDKDLMEIVYILSVNGHSEHIDEITDRTRKQFGYFHDCIHTIYRLVNAKQDETAFKLVLTMSRSSDPEMAPVGQFFIRHLVKTDVPFDKVLEYCDELKRQNLNNVGLLRATESALVHQKPDYAVKLMEKLKEQGMTLRSHYFWPIIAHFRSTNNVEGIYNTLSKMIDLGCIPNFDTLLDYVYPSLDLKDPDAIIQKLKAVGLSVGTIVHPLATYLLTENRLQTAAKLVRTYPVRLLGNSMIPHLSRATVEARDLPSALQILHKINTSREVNQENDLNGHFIVDYYKHCDFNYQKLEELLTGFKSHGFKISSSAADFARSKFRGAVPTVINELLQELQSENLTGVVFESLEQEHDGESYSPLNEMSVAQLEHRYEEFKAKNMNVRGVMRRLLIIYCRDRNVDKALKMKNELDNIGFSYSASMYATLMDLYSNNNDIEKAMECKRLVLEADSEFRLDDHKILNLAAEMVKAGKYDDAINLINSHHESNGVKDKPELIGRSNWKVLNAAAEKEDSQLVQKLFDLLHSKGFIVPTNVVLGPLVKVHLLKNDLQAALQAFENCCRKFNCTPWKNDLLMQFIKLEDADRLQKVVDLSSEVHGEMNTMYDLAYAFISSNQYKQARKILETPGLRARRQRLQSICEKFREENKAEQLEQLINITKDLFDVDRDDMYYQLILMYDQLNQPEKALGVWTSMQEESVHPRNRTLIVLSQLLKKHKLPVPFAIPAEETSSSTLNAENTVNTDITTLIRNNRLDDALELRRKLDNDLTVKQSTLLIEALLKNERLNEAVNMTKELLSKNSSPLPIVLKFLLSKLAIAADVDTIEYIGRHIDTELRKTVSLSNYICRAYVNGNRSEELLQWLEKGFPDNQSSFPNRGILSLLKSNPDYIDRVNKLALSYAAKNYLLPLNMIWVHHFTNENYEKADEILKSNPEFNNRLIFIDVVRLSRDTKNESMAAKLVDVVKASQMIEQLKCMAYCGLIDIQCDKNEIESALKTYEESAKLGLNRSNYKESTLERLRKALQELEKPVPASLAAQQKPQASSSDSSSSSSDSSDDEKDKRRG